MKLTLFDYHLDPERIAQYPLEKRDSSRLLVLNRATGEIEHRIFSDIMEFLNEGDILIINDTKVVPARLNGKKLSGGKVEVLLVRKLDEYRWSALVRGLRKGIVVFNGGVRAKVNHTDQETLVTFLDCKAEEVMNKIGKMPLPPYINRNTSENDKSRYQTVYAKEDGAIAAPTAGLHFTQDILKKIESKRVIIQNITLHVGWGTFKPIRNETIEDHIMGQEDFHISHNTAQACQKVKAQGGRVFAVGTTVTRALESAFCEGKVRAGSDATTLFIYPGYKFNVVDAFITNFHLPRSSPLVLTAAFAGIELIKKAYTEAQTEDYRFYSYGDAMLIV